MAVDSMAKATIHEPVGAKDLWKHKGWQLPAYIQHVANDLRTAGHPESRAIAMAVGIIRNWAAGHDGKGKPVHPDTQAAAAKALAEWEALKARAAASRGASLTAEQSQTVDLAAWDGAKHPRVSKGKAGGGRFAGKNSNDGGPPEDVQAQVRDFQRRHGLPVTGQFDAATTKLMQYHASGAAAKAAAGAKKAASGAKAAARKQASAAKRAAAKAARDRKHAQALAKAKAKREAAAKKKAEKAAATAAKQRASATVSAVNKLTPAQRRVYRAKSPTPPAGYAWGAGNRLVSVTSARAQSAVSKTLGPAPKPAAKTAAKPKAKATSFRQMLSRRKALSLSEQATGIDLAMSVTSTTDGPSLTVPAGSLTAKAKRVLLRRKMAMPPATAGGAPRFPIRNQDDVKKAVRAVGRAKGDHAKVRAHIVRRAKAVNAMHLIPDHWSEK